MWNPSRSAGLYYKGSLKRKQKPNVYIYVAYHNLLADCSFGFQNHLIQEFNKDTVPGMAMDQSKVDVMTVVKYCFIMDY